MQHLLKLSFAPWVSVTAVMAASAYATPPPSVPAALLADLVEQARTRVKTFSRPVMTYHWTHRSDVQIPLQGAVADSDPRFSQYLDRRYKTYSRPDPHNQSMLGAGLYLSSDPVATRSYGGRNWVLFGLEFKAGAKYLDLIGDNGLPANLVTSLSVFGCSASSLSEIWDLDSTPACEAIRIALGTSPNLKISALRYGYLSTSFVECRPRSTPGYGEAFVAWNGDGFNPAHSIPLVQETPLSGSARTFIRQVQGLADEAIQNFRSLHGSNTSAIALANTRAYERSLILFPTIHGQIPMSELQAWMQHSISSCGGYAEDQAIP